MYIIYFRYEATCAYACDPVFFDPSQSLVRNLPKFDIYGYWILTSTFKHCRLVGGRNITTVSLLETGQTLSIGRWMDLKGDIVGVGGYHERHPRMGTPEL